MHHHVCAEFQGVLKHWGEESVVNHTVDLLLSADLCDCCDVYSFKSRIGRSFQPDELKFEESLLLCLI